MRLFSVAAVREGASRLPGEYLSLGRQESRCCQCLTGRPAVTDDVQPFGGWLWRDYFCCANLPGVAERTYTYWNPAKVFQYCPRRLPSCGGFSLWHTYLFIASFILTLDACAAPGLSGTRSSAPQQRPSRLAEAGIDHETAFHVRPVAPAVSRIRGSSQPLSCNASARMGIGLKSLDSYICWQGRGRWRFARWGRR